MSKKLIRFDWAIKKLLRHKANFTILEGFLSELLKFDVLIESILESESNKQHEYDKFNRVDILVKTTQDELMFVEIQNDPEMDYFQRMIYGVSKLMTEYIQEGEPYGTIKKVFSINIVYFGLGQGKDYVYEYRGEFIGLHYQDVLQASQTQIDTFKIRQIADIFPKYFILKVNNFNDIAIDNLDEWIYFLKNSEIKEEFKAKGLLEAKEKLKIENISLAERKDYERFTENRRIEKGVLITNELEARKKEKIGIAKEMIVDSLTNEKIIKYTDLSKDEIEQIRAEIKC